MAILLSKYVNTLFFYQYNIIYSYIDINISNFIFYLLLPVFFCFPFLYISIKFSVQIIIKKHRGNVYKCDIFVINNCLTPKDNIIYLLYCYVINTFINIK